MLCFALVINQPNIACKIVESRNTLKHSFACNSRNTEDGLKALALSKPILFFLVSDSAKHNKCIQVECSQCSIVRKWVLSVTQLRAQTASETRFPLGSAPTDHRHRHSGKSICGKVRLRLCSNSPQLLPDANLRRSNSIGYCRLNRVQLGPIRFRLRDARAPLMPPVTRPWTAAEDVTRLKQVSKFNGITLKVTTVYFYTVSILLQQMKLKYIAYIQTEISSN